MNLGDKDYSLADIARYENPNYNDNVIRNWIRSPNPVEFDGFRLKVEAQNIEPEKGDK